MSALREFREAVVVGLVWGTLVPPAPTFRARLIHRAALALAKALS